MQRLVDLKNTLVVIEHNMDIIKNADYIIDLGPEGGDEGGWVVATGTPEQIATDSRSYTGKYLRTFLDAWQQPKKLISEKGAEFHSDKPYVS